MKGGFVNHQLRDRAFELRKQGKLKPKMLNTNRVRKYQTKLTGFSFTKNAVIPRQT